jgi:two-component system sensor histidine kinase VicK
MTNFVTFFKKAFSFKLKKEEFTEKIGLISIGAALAIIVIIMSLVFLYMKQNRMKELMADGFDLTEKVASYSAKGLDKTEANNIIKIVGLMGSKSGLVYAIIMDVNGQVIAHTNISFVDHLLTDPIALRAASSNNFLKQVYNESSTNRTIHEFSRPIYRDRNKVGAVRLGFSLYAHPIFSNSDIMGILLMAILVFSLVPIFYYCVRRSLGPISALNDELKNLLARDNFKKIEVDSADVAGKLVEKFNEAITRLQEKYNKLEVWHDNLDIANRVLSYEKERTESVIENINDGILVTDSVGSIILVNRTMAYLMELPPDKVIGKTIKECIENKDILSFIEKNQFDGRTFSQKNEEITLKQLGRESIVLISYLQLLGPSESVMGSVITTRDITAEKMAQHNQSDFIANVADELRTPLTTIKSYVEMLMDGKVSDQETKIGFFNTINDEANHLSRLIGNLLNISKIETGSLTIQKDIVKSREFLVEMIKSIEGRASSKNIKLESDLPDKLSPLAMAKDLVSVAILNILGNAIQYTPEGGAVTFRAEEDESNMNIHITDTGCGISKEDLLHVFDKFFKSADEKIKGQTGNGLGLALTKEIIKLHDGTVDVVSVVGEGTHFTISLPREESPKVDGAPVI